MSNTNATQNWRLYPGSNSIRVIAPYAAWRLLQAYLGDNSVANLTFVNSTYMPYYYCNYRITRIAYTPLNLRVR